MIKQCPYCEVDTAGNHEKDCPNYVENYPISSENSEWKFSYGFEKFSKENVKLDRIIALLEKILDRLEKNR